MKHSLIYALPVLLAACGPTVTQADGADMPAPTPLKADKATAAKSATPAAQETQIAGTWSQTDETTAVFTGEDGAEIVKLRCLPANEDQGTGPVLALQRPIATASDATSIGVFTDAGAISMPASVDTQGGVITGTIAADAPRISALAVGQGSLKLRAGNSIYVLDNAKAVESIVTACRPAPAKANAGDAAEDNGTDSSNSGPSSQM